MDKNDLIESAINEAQMIKSLSNNERDELGFYATDSDLSQLIKTLRRVANPNERKRIKLLNGHPS